MGYQEDLEKWEKHNVKLTDQNEEQKADNKELRDQNEKQKTEFKDLKTKSEIQEKKLESAGKIQQKLDALKSEYQEDLEKWEKHNVDLRNQNEKQKTEFEDLKTKSEI